MRWRRCFDGGLFFIDNGEPERQIRYPPKAAVPTSSPEATTALGALATAYTLVAACRIESINTWEYLADVLEKLAANWPRDRVDELLPDAWKRARDVRIEIHDDLGTGIAVTAHAPCDQA